MTTPSWRPSLVLHLLPSFQLETLSTSNTPYITPTIFLKSSSLPSIIVQPSTMSTRASAAGTRLSSRSRRRSGHCDSVPVKKESYGPSANILGKSVNVSKRIDKIYALLKGSRDKKSKQMNGYDFVCVSDEDIFQMFRSQRSINFPAPPLHHRREVSQLRRWFGQTGKEERQSILADANNYEIITSHFENPVWSESQG